MKKLRWLVLIPAILVCIGCEDRDDEPDIRCPVVASKGPEDDITGKWKLVRTERISSINPLLNDFSCDDITYHFQENDSLTIYSSNEDYIGHPTGEHRYEFIPSPFNQKTHVLAIEGTQYACVISNENMELDLEPLPGPLGPLREFRIVLYFMRVQ